MGNQFYRTGRFCREETGFHIVGIFAIISQRVDSLISSKSDVDEAGWGRKDNVLAGWA